MDNNEILKSIPREKKIQFLEKLKSGKFKLAAPYQPQPKVNFDLQSNGLYLCREDRRLMTAKEIQSLPGYMLIIEQVSTPSQANHEEPAEGYTLIPFSKQDYLNGLLVSVETGKVSGGDFNAALSEMSTDELMALHSQLLRDEKNKK